MGMIKKLKIINIILFCLSVLCFGVSSYLTGLKCKLPLPDDEETRKILKYYKTGLSLENIGIILVLVLFITALLYIILRHKYVKTDNSEKIVDAHK